MAAVARGARAMAARAAAALTEAAADSEGAVGASTLRGVREMSAQGAAQDLKTTG